MKNIYKEYDKKVKMEQQMKKSEDNITLRQEKIKVANAEIAKLTKQVEELKEEAKRSAAASKEKVSSEKISQRQEEEYDEFSGKSMEELKRLLKDLQGELADESKVATKIRQELKVQILLTKKKLKELGTETSAASHRITELTRVIQHPKSVKGRGIVKHAKSEAKICQEEFKKRLLHKSKYKRMILKHRTSVPLQESGTTDLSEIPGTEPNSKSSIHISKVARKTSLSKFESSELLATHKSIKTSRENMTTSGNDQNISSKLA